MRGTLSSGQIRTYWVPLEAVPELVHRAHKGCPQVGGPWRLSGHLTLRDRPVQAGEPVQVVCPHEQRQEARVALRQGTHRVISNDHLFVMC